MALHNFCAWQKTLNEQGLTHHDVAVLVTRKSICETSGNNCGILGKLIVGYPGPKHPLDATPNPLSSQNYACGGGGGRSLRKHITRRRQVSLNLPVLCLGSCSLRIRD